VISGTATLEFGAASDANAAFAGDGEGARFVANVKSRDW